MQARAPAQWTLWRQTTRSPEELLLTLGIAEAPSATFRRAFPLAETDLALAGSRVLAASGLHHRSLYYAEVVGRRLPADLPHQFLPNSFRRLLYPRPWAYLIAQQSSRFGVDPDLLSAIMREESRFNPLAISGAAARGLTQFVWPTAVRLGAKLGWDELEVTDLHRPEIAITLGASYLAELSDRFAGRTVQMVAAYNAGEELARLWQAYCFSREPEEYYSKVGFRQTRIYLEKVLTGRAYYAQVYGDGDAAWPVVVSTESTSGGKVSKLLSK
jgi:soluble lytic murein transglycosylase-like protein